MRFDDMINRYKIINQIQNQQAMNYVDVFVIVTPVLWTVAASGILMKSTKCFKQQLSLIKSK